ncbi:MAG: 3-hydroxyacyl-CoA dehydrogenase NAD-binding domain-containing protein [Ferruginibacter sp.]
MIENVCVAGGGTMGRGIALAAAQAGFKTILFDINEVMLEAARSQISAILDSQESKQKITAQEKQLIHSSFLFTSDIEACKAGLIIEAIIEKLEVKEDLLQKLAEINDPHTILASNTSSLSISSIQKNITNPRRVAGMHFFNPANLMKLVEVVKGDATSDEVVNKIMDVCRQMGKTPVLCLDAPGFIVNRVARPYYLEAMKLVEENKASIEDIDSAMEACGFKMGPFKLMDLIGLDINLAVSNSVYEAMKKKPRFTPSIIQQQKVADGDLGRKTGKGFYIYNK